MAAVPIRSYPGQRPDDTHRLRGDARIQALTLPPICRTPESPNPRIHEAAFRRRTFRRTSSIGSSGGDC